MKYFAEDEFACKCGCGDMAMSPSFLVNMDNARGISGVPYLINSGKRCEAHNREVGGVPESSHLKGLAADIAAIDPRSRYHILAGLMAAGFNRIGIGNTFIHADDDPSKAPDVIWLY